MSTPSASTEEPAGTQHDGTDVLDGIAAGGLLIRGGTLRILSYGAMVALSTASTIVLTRHLGVVKFGEYTTVMSLVGMIAAVTDVGMTNVGTREYVIRTGPDRDSYMRDLLGLRIVLTLAGSALSTAFALAVGWDLPLVLGTVAASLATVALIVEHTYSIPLYARLRLKTISALEVSRQATWVAGLIALAVAGAGVLPLLAMMLVAYAALVPPTAWMTRGQIPLRLRLHASSWPAMLAPTAMLSLATAVGTIYIYAAQILMSLVTDHHQTGLFAVSFRVVVTTAGIPGLIASAALPLLSRAARDDHERLAYIVRRFLEVSLAGGIAVALVLSAGAPFVVSVIAGHSFAAVRTVLEIQAFALIGTFVAAPSSLGLLSLGLYREMLVGNGAALIFTLAATAVLAKLDGAQGAAIATICGETVLALVMFASLARRSPRCGVDRRVAAKLLAAGLCTAPVAVLLPIPSLSRAVATAMIYGTLLLVSKSLPREVLVALAGWGRSE